MTRIVLENIFFFLLPTLAYIAWQAYRRNDWPGLGVIIGDAPLLRLFVLGGTLMLATLAAFALLSPSTGGRPGDAYQPPVVKDGHVQPGRTVHEQK